MKEVSWSKIEALYAQESVGSEFRHTTLSVKELLNVLLGRAIANGDAKAKACVEELKKRWQVDCTRKAGYSPITRKVRKKLK